MAIEDGKNSPDLGAVTPASQTSGAGPTQTVNGAGDYLEETVDPEEYARLLDLYDNSFRHISEGEVVKGTVLKVTASEVVVDVGYKSEGIISVDEFVDENGQISVQPGDSVDVLLERTEDRDGYVVLSREKAEKMKIWDEIEKAYADRKVVIGRVIERIKGGLAVDIGVRAFLPGSQVDVRPVRNLDALRGQELRMRVIKVNKKRGNIVLSRKVLLEEENAEKKKFTLATLAEGKVLRGVVKNITDYGAFIDLGGIDGLLHITDMSWGRVGHPSEIFKVNDEIDVIVLKYDPATERVSLGHKQLVPDPWSNVNDRYPVGYRVSGKTGTAWKASEAGGYSTNKYMAVFGGVVPASNPRLAAVVVIDEPTGGVYYGGEVAAPVFSAVMSGALRLLAIPPDDLQRMPATTLVQAQDPW